MMTMHNLVCLITGSTSGIGEAIAKSFLEQGALVVVTGLPGSLSWDVKSYGDRVLVVYGDLEDIQTPHNLVSATLRQFEKLDVLVNNAATMERGNSFSTNVEMFDRIMAINVRSPFLLCEASFKALSLTRGCILNIGSSNGYCGEANLLPYSISKGALQTLSRNLADAWASAGIRVNHFVVGWVLTRNEYNRKIQDGLGINWHLEPPLGAVPFGTMTKPEVIGTAAVYWCSGQSWPLSGNVIELEQFPLVGRNSSKVSR
jgi:NAD(P)-dependent dehydrogenase (short-subunit alcohol dehydrogenase family)